MKTGLVFALMLGFAAATMLRAAEPAQRDRPGKMLAASLTFSVRYWDDAAGLLWSAAPGEEQSVHRVRESSWYALGLLQRHQPGDEARAVRIVERVLAFQFAAPGRPWDGTFRRAPEEPPPGPDAQLWKNYDPNWRQFIGTTFVLMLEEHAAQLPAELQARMLAAIRRAVESELSQGRTEAYYTNIALLHGFLLGWAGRRFDRAEWVAQSEGLIRQIRQLFAAHETFAEYNSPTYYGVDLYGLALCRRFGATEKIRAAGAEMEAGLWRDVARFYHAGLKNMCGPFDRTYGMDMRRYVSLTGLWLALVLPPELAPLPDPAGPMGHAHDFWFIPLAVALGARVPADALAGFHAFQGERLLRRPIEGPRVATAWLSRDLMLGGELTGATRPAGPDTIYHQFCPATLHWRVPGGEVGWAQLYAAPAGDAEAGKDSLAITAPAAGDFTFRASASGLAPGKFARDRWTLPGLAVRIETDAADFAATAGDGFIEVRYRGATRLLLRTSLEEKP